MVSYISFTLLYFRQAYCPLRSVFGTSFFGVMNNPKTQHLLDYYRNARRRSEERALEASPPTSVQMELPDVNERKQIDVGYIPCAQASLMAEADRMLEEGEYSRLNRYGELKCPPKPKLVLRNRRAEAKAEEEAKKEAEAKAAAEAKNKRKRQEQQESEKDEKKPEENELEKERAKAEKREEQGRPMAKAKFRELEKAKAEAKKRPTRK